jgi:uncharacterized protein YjdB
MRTFAALACLAAACSAEPASIRVKLPKDGMGAQKAEPTLPVFKRRGETMTLRASAYNGSDTYMGPAKVKWSSSDTSVAAIDPDGRMTIVGSGETQVVAKGDGYAKELTAALPVRARIVDSVKIIAPPKFTKIRIGQEVKLGVEVKDDKGNPLTDARVFWRNEDHGVWAHEDGMIRGASLGTATVTAEAGGKTAALTFEVVE